MIIMILVACDTEEISPDTMKTTFFGALNIRNGVRSDDNMKNAPKMMACF